MSFLSPLARTLSPYVPGEQISAKIKLNTNENAYGPSPKVAEAIAKAIPKLNLYPEPESDTLRQAISAYIGGNIGVNNIFVGNGSDDVLSMAFIAFLAGGAVATPEITYSFYPVYANLYRVDYRTVPMKKDFEIDIPGLIAARRPIILANPNAPTSLAVSLSKLKKMADTLMQQRQLLIIDEAYVAFGGETAIPLVREFENVLVIQTLSKSHALAGLRLGYAVGSPQLIEAMTRVKNCINSYPVDRLAQAGGIAALEDKKYFIESRDKIIATRTWFSNTISKFGYKVLPSSANFVFASPLSVSGQTVYHALRAQGILVRHFDTPILRQWIRISIGTQSEMEILARALEKLRGTNG